MNKGIPDYRGMMEKEFSMLEFRQLMKQVSDGFDKGDRVLQSYGGMVEKRLGLPAVQVEILAYLTFHKDSIISEEALARMLDVSHTAVSLNVIRLQRKGLLIMEDDIIDVSRQAFDKLLNEFNKNIENMIFNDDFNLLDELVKRIPTSTSDAVSFEDFRKRTVALAVANKELQIGGGLVSLHETIKSDRAFYAMVRLLDEFRNNGLTPVMSPIEGADELADEGYCSVELIDCGDSDYQNGYVITSEVAHRCFLGHPELLKGSIYQYAELEKADSIAQKELFFEPQNISEIDMLQTLLKPEEYERIQARMASKGMKPGITVLMHGRPGVGKTELARQICKASGRDMLMVRPEKLNFSHLGESEKAMAGLFRNYRYLGALSRNRPVLFMDECDGIFKARTNASDPCSNVENTLQNIILEELSSRFSGILICTTNRAQSLDPAMERRMLMKIDFASPTLESRKKIIRSMSPDLKDALVDIIAEYDFAGGNLHNIIKKIDMYEVVYGKPAGQELVTSFCNAERISAQTNSKRKPIGYVQY